MHASSSRQDRSTIRQRHKLPAARPRRRSRLQQRARWSSSRHRYRHSRPWRRLRPRPLARMWRLRPDTSRSTSPPGTSPNIPSPAQGLPHASNPEVAPPSLTVASTLFFTREPRITLSSCILLGSSSPWCLQILFFLAPLIGCCCSSVASHSLRSLFPLSHSLDPFPSRLTFTCPSALAAVHINDAGVSLIMNDFSCTGRPRAREVDIAIEVHVQCTG